VNSNSGSGIAGDESKGTKNDTVIRISQRWVGDSTVLHRNHLLPNNNMVIRKFLTRKKLFEDHEFNNGTSTHRERYELWKWSVRKPFSIFLITSVISYSAEEYVARLLLMNGCQVDLLEGVCRIVG
jgi:hypothetical protein